MLPLCKIPTLVDHYSGYYAEMFSEQAFEHFQRMVSGLMLSENKTIQAINRLFFLDAKHPNSLNNFMNHSPYHLEDLDACRLKMLQDCEATRMKSVGKAAGCLSIDDTLLSHYGKCIEYISRLWDHTINTNILAHNLVTLHYSDDNCDYPVYYELWKPANIEKLEQALIDQQVHINTTHQANKEQTPVKWRRYLLNRYSIYQFKKPALQQTYKTKLHIAQALISQYVRTYPDHDLPICFDTWYTQPELCRYINKEVKRAYVGQVKESELLVLQGGKETTLKTHTEKLLEQHQALDDPFTFNKTTIPYKGKKEVYYTYCATRTTKRFGKQRLVISFSGAAFLQDPFKATARFFISNRFHWNASGICRISRHRWPVEVYHQEGKAEGLDQYQLRNFKAIQRHIALVVVVYSMLQCARHDPDLLPKLQYQLNNQLDGSIASWRRVVDANAFYDLVQWIFLATQRGQSLEKILELLMKTIAHS